MVQIVKKLSKKKKTLLSSASHIRAISAPSPTHFPGATSSQVFPPVQTSLAKPYWVFQTGNNLCHPSPFFTPLLSWRVGHFLPFPRTLLHSSCPPGRGHLSQEAWGNTEFLLLAAGLTDHHLYRVGDVTKPRTLGEKGRSHFSSPWPRYS